MKDASELKVGDKIWFFNTNHRVYRRDENGRSIGGPIWREHWQEKEILAEAPRTWIVGMGWEWVRSDINDGKVPRGCWRLPKKGVAPMGWAFSQGEIDDQEWIDDYVCSISQAVNRCRDAEVLKKIAELVGWKPKESHG